MPTTICRNENDITSEIMLSGTQEHELYKYCTCYVVNENHRWVKNFRRQKIPP